MAKEMTPKASTTSTNEKPPAAERRDRGEIMEKWERLLN